jgi:capsular exopolysaccharide synthesis family protein
MSEDKLAVTLAASQKLSIPTDSYRPAQGWDGDLAGPPRVPLSHYLWILKRHCYKILSFIFVAVAGTWVFSSRITPVYESTAKVEIDRQTPLGVVGQESMPTAVADADQFLATQIDLIQSDSVLRPVADQFKVLHTEGEVRQTEDDGIDAEAPVGLPGLTVTRPTDTYLLLITYRSPDRRLAADVANAVARSYLDHTYDIRLKASARLSAFMERQLEELKAKMERSSAALAQFERELNVISPEEKTNILSARLLQLNNDYTKAQSERIGKEAAWRSVRDDTLEAAAASSQGEVLKKIAEKLSEAQQKFADVQTRYGENHPEFRRAAGQLAELERQFQNMRDSVASRVEVEYHEALNRESMLQKSVAEAKAEFDRLNAHSFEYQARKQEAAADKKLYEELVGKIKEAGINAGFQNSNIRIVDDARPARAPVFPKLKLNLILAFLLSTLLAAGIAVISDTLNNTVRDAAQVRTLLGIDVIGSLPRVKNWRGKLAVAANTSEPAESRALVKRERNHAHATATFQEAVRTLRNSILLGSFGQQLRSLMVTSACPMEGKTTIAVHLALAHSQQQLKTLLIDCDFRRPSVHHRLGLSQGAGLAAVLQNGLHWQEKLITSESAPNLDVLPAGHGSRQAMDFIGRSLPQILDEAAEKYDLVVVDSPPVLGIPEPLQMATSVDGVVLVAKAGETNRKVLSSALGTLQRLRANVVGLVLNEVTKEMGDGYHYYDYSGYYGRDSSRKETQE